MPDPITKAHAAVDYVHSEHRRQIREKNRQINALQAEKGELQRALQERPRTLTAANISDEMVERAWRKSNDITQDWGLSLGAARDVLVAALTQPQPRPEGAEAAEEYLRGFLGSVEFACDIDAGWLADHLIETLNDSGVRVTGGN